MSKKIRYILGWIFVRPRRWLFWKMICNAYLRILPQKKEYEFGWRLPNLHWWILYITVFKFCKWLNYDAWRKFCTYKNGWLDKKPLIAKIIHRIGETTAGYAIHGGECYHCGSEAGDQVTLSDDETGEFFKLERTWSVGTMDGTDHRFCGTTICPKCGYKEYYEDGSL